MLLRQQEQKLWYTTHSLTLVSLAEHTCIQLKKRQREKAGGVSSTTSSPNVVIPSVPERTFSPAPSEFAEEDKRDLGDM